MRIIVILLFSYLLGAIPSGYIFTSFLKGVDVRKVGSGNVGATNTARVLGFKYGVLVALLDVLKGFLAVSVAHLFMPVNGVVYLPYLAGLMAIIGHDFSLFLLFSGGKGVATTMGAVLRLSPVICLITVIIWVLLVLISRYVSLASIFAALLLPVLAMIFLDNISAIIFLFIYGLLIVIKHHENIKRLLNGEENRINSSS